MSLDFIATDQAVRDWLVSYYSMRLHELRNGPTDYLPNLPLRVDGQFVESYQVDFLVDDDTLVVYVDISGRYLGAILRKKGEWWLPVAPPREVPEEKLGLMDLHQQIQMLQYLGGL